MKAAGAADRRKQMNSAEAEDREEDHFSTEKGLGNEAAMTDWGKMAGGETVEEAEETGEESAEKVEEDGKEAVEEA